nr:MAG TPA: hypothetical protein [Caudoviricetes sp.]
MNDGNGSRNSDIDDCAHVSGIHSWRDDYRAYLRNFSMLRPARYNLNDCRLPLSEELEALWISPSSYDQCIYWLDKKIKDTLRSMGYEPEVARKLMEEGRMNICSQRIGLLDVDISVLLDNHELFRINFRGQHIEETVHKKRN